MRNIFRKEDNSSRHLGEKWLSIAERYKHLKEKPEFKEFMKVFVDFLKLTFQVIFSELLNHYLN
jgi:hypothetical protein